MEIGTKRDRLGDVLSDVAADILPIAGSKKAARAQALVYADRILRSYNDDRALLRYYRFLVKNNPKLTHEEAAALAYEQLEDFNNARQ